MSKSTPKSHHSNLQQQPRPSATPRLILQIEVPLRRMLAQPLNDSITAGRAGDDDPNQPDIDLTPAGAKDAGVSRLHVRFSYHDETLFIEDLGSTNGTRINGFELVTGKSYRLTAGDEIELGSMRLTARVARPL